MSTALDQLADEVIDHRFKGLPPDATGRTVGALAEERRGLYDGGFTTPVLTLSAEALEHNLTALADFAGRQGMDFAPHGKTSMAPQLFQRQLDHGAWGITVAVPHQARVARAFGVPRLFLANEVVDPAALAWLAGELDADPEFRCVIYVDSVHGVRLMESALEGAGAVRPVEVVLELGVPGGRTGVRDQETALRVAQEAASSPRLRLIGVAGYEGEVPGADLASVGAWLSELVATAAELDKAGVFRETEEIMLSAGGSAWFDVVARTFAQLPDFSRPVRTLLRSGAYVSHDDGQYRDVTPFNRAPEQGSLRPAFRLWAQVVSQPEPGLALLNAGKRDVAYDLHLPEVHGVRGADGVTRPAEGLRITKLSDQHAFLRAPEPVGTAAETAVPEVGSWVALGMSHPCTIFEKWPLIPMVTEDGTVTEYIRTFF